MSAQDSGVEAVSRFRQWIGWLPLLAFCLFALVGYRVWTDKLKQSPVDPVHARFLDFMAERSPKARAYRLGYEQNFGRNSVASEHFEQVCAVMYRLAVEDKVDPAAHSSLMAKGCKAFGRKHPGTSLPHSAPQAQRRSDSRTDSDQE
jgi:hypothetical protein